MEEKTRQEQLELFAREEACAKAIRVLARSLLLRLIVPGILAAGILLHGERTIFLIVLTVFVMAVALQGAVPLTRELIKQIKRMQELRAQEA